MATEIATYLKFVNVQLAAEALYGKKNAPAGDTFFGPIDPLVLTDGNTRSSKFTTTQADEFSKDWAVVEHKSNTSTGFSGTLFRALRTDEARGITQGELVMSFRSTEFIDDAVRDNQATNTLEVKEFGWAFGQIADMEDWYASLKADSSKLGNQSFSVTGYSLGGHLATAFNLMREQDARLAGVPNPIISTYTFNGAGVGETNNAQTLSNLIADFDRKRKNVSGNEIVFTDPDAKALYAELRPAFGAAGTSFSAEFIRSEAARIERMRRINPIDAPIPIYAPTQRNAELARLQLALERIASIQAEAVRVPTLASGSGAQAQNIQGPANIEALRLDYQLAVLEASRQTNGYRTDVASGAYDAAFGRNTRGPLSGSFYDLYGSNFGSGNFSAVSNSQLHYGKATGVWIEDQPLYRGQVLAEVGKETFKAGEVKLLVPEFSNNDFGDTHSLVLIVDSLSVQNVLSKLDAGLQPSTLTSILQAASNSKASSASGTQGKADGDTLENVLSALARVLGVAGITLKGNLSGGTWALVDDKGGYTGRDAFQKLVSDIDKKIKDDGLAGMFSISTTHDATVAKTDFAALVSLVSGATFSLRAKDAAAKTLITAKLGAAFSEELALFNADQTAREQGQTIALNYTENYLNDRAALLNWQIKADLDNVQADSAGVIQVNAPASYGVKTQYVDWVAGQKIKVGNLNVLTDATKYITFGDSQTNLIDGDFEADRLYGGGGDDTVNGKAGADYLEGNTGDDTLDGGKGSDILVGGAGSDTYILRASDSGVDTIIDSDGQGAIKVIAADGSESILGTGTIKRIDNGTGLTGSWKSEDKRFTYTTQAEAGGRSTLSISGAGFNAVVKNFKSGDLGITLGQDVLEADGLKVPVYDLTHEFHQSSVMDSLFHQWNQVDQTVTDTVHLSWVSVDEAKEIFRGSMDGSDFLLEYASGDLNDNFIDTRTTPTRILALRGGDDVALLHALPGGVPMVGADGGAGNDVIEIAPDAVVESISGGAGNDVLTAAGSQREQIIYGDFDPTLKSNSALHMSHGETLKYFYLGIAFWDYALPPPGYGWSGWQVVQDQTVTQTDHYERPGDALYAITSNTKTLQYTATTVTGDTVTMYGEETREYMEAPWPVFVSPLSAKGMLTDGFTGIYGTPRTDTKIVEEIRTDEKIEIKTESQMGVSVPRQEWIEDPLTAVRKVVGAAPDAVTYNDYDDTIVGGDARDWLYGQQGSDAIWGGGGNDVITTDELPHLRQEGLQAELAALEKLLGKPGDDYADGGDGDDSITDDVAGSDILMGGAGNDQLVNAETVNLDQVYVNFLDGQDGDDALVSTNPTGGMDTLRGGAGNDSLTQLAGQAVMEGGDGDDRLDASASSNNSWQMLDGGRGNDTLLGGAGDDSLVGGEGADVMDGGSGNDSFWAGAGDTVTDGGGVDSLMLADGEPVSVTADGADVLLGYGNQGTLRIVDALRGSIEFIDGILMGDWLKDRLSNAVQVESNGANQSLSGGAGNDTLTTSDAGVRLSGGKGNDTYVLGNASAMVAELAGEGTDTVQSTVGHTLAEDVENLTLTGTAAVNGTGNTSNNVITGNAADNVLTGGAGNDTLNGSDGDDMLYGEGGDDVLYASRGKDTLAGGAGLDTYVLNYSADRNTVVDDSAEGSIIKLGAAGMKFEDLAAARRGNDLVVEVRGTSASMRIKDYYASTQTSWVFEDAQGNTTTGEALVEASRMDWAQLQANLLKDFQSSTLGSISRSYSDSGYTQRVDGSWYLAVSYEVDISRTYVKRTGFFRDLSGVTSSYIAAEGWSGDPPSQPAIDTTATITFQANNVASGTDTIQSYNDASSLENAWSSVQWTKNSSNHFGSDWQPEFGTDGSGSVGLTGYTRVDIDTDYYSGTANQLTFQDPGAAALTGNLPGYVAVDFVHYQTSYNLGPSLLADGDQTVWADSYAAVIGGTGNNTIYGAGFAYGGTGNAQLIGGGTLMAGTGDQYLEGGKIMVVGDGHDTVVGRTGSHILVNPDNQGVDLIGYDFYPEMDTDGMGRSLTVGAIYQAMGYQDWTENFLGGGKFYFNVLETFSGYFDSLAEARAAYEANTDWITFDEAMAYFGTEWRYVEPLTVLYTSPYSSFGTGPGSDYRPSPYYDTHPVPIVVLTANDFARLQPLVDAELIPGGVITFGPGLSLADLTLSWGEATASLDGGTHVTLDVLWGTDQGIRIMMPRTGDALNTVVQQFEFSDGTVSSLLDLIALAPPMPDLDVGYAQLYAGMGEQTADAVDLAGIRAVVASADNLKVESDGVDLVISIIGSSDSLRIAGWYADANAMSQAILFTSGGAVFSAAEMTGKGLLKDGSAGGMDLHGVPGFATTFIAGPNTRMTGASGMDTYVYNQGSGEVHITDPGGGAVRFGSGVSTTATLGLGDGSLLIQLGNQGDVIYLENFDPSDAENFESVLDFEFSNGSTLSLQDLLDQGFDLTGTSDADIITGTSVTDRILAGTGDDVLEGGAGNDVYLYSRGDGSDRIEDYDETAGNVDTLRFDSTIAVSDIKVTRSPEDLYLEIAGTGDRITLGGWFIGGGSSLIEQIEFHDGTVWDAATLESLVVVGAASEGSDELVGTVGDDTINGLGGDDELMGVGGDDTLDGGAGNDYLAGGAGSDVYLFGRGSGQDVILEFTETEGDIDTLRFDGTVETADVTVTRDQTGILSLSINGTDDRVQLNNWFADNTDQFKQVERVEFANGTIWNAQTLTDMATFLGTPGQDNIAGSQYADMLRGLDGDDSLFGGEESDALEGGDGDDNLSDMAGSSNYFNGGSGDDQMLSGVGANLFIGGTGNDSITSESGPDVIAFNVGDGQDTLHINGSEQSQDDTISLGGAGLDYANLSLQKNGSDLVLKVSGTDQLTLADWYSGTPKQSVLNLQLVAEAMAAFDANSSDPLLNKKVQTFDFQGLVGAFDAARTATPGLSNWALSNGLTQFHLAGSDSEALGGDLAYHYGADGTLAGIGLGKAQDVLTSALFGAQAQAINPTGSLQEGLIRLG
jgi:Ca2+-binding RTX toxin-like protein